MSELDIVTGEDIFVAINRGRNDCLGMIADVTEESLQSVWVQKEFIASLSQETKACIVFDGINGRPIEALNSPSPGCVMSSLNITTMFSEYIDCLKKHAKDTGLFFAFPYVEAEIFGNRYRI